MATWMMPFKSDEPFVCLNKGAYCARCDDQFFCCDIGVVEARREFQAALFEAIIAGKPLPTIVTHMDE